MSKIKSKLNFFHRIKQLRSQTIIYIWCQYGGFITDSREVLSSSISPTIKLQRRSVITYASCASSRLRCSSSTWTWISCGTTKGSVSVHNVINHLCKSIAIKGTSTCSRSKVNNCWISKFTVHYKNMREVIIFLIEANLNRKLQRNSFLTALNSAMYDSFKGIELKKIVKVRLDADLITLESTIQSVVDWNSRILNVCPTADVTIVFTVFTKLTSFTVFYFMIKKQMRKLEFYPYKLTVTIMWLILRWKNNKGNLNYFTKRTLYPCIYGFLIFVRRECLL